MEIGRSLILNAHDGISATDVQRALVSGAIGVVVAVYYYYKHPPSNYSGYERRGDERRTSDRRHEA